MRKQFPAIFLLLCVLVISTVAQQPAVEPARSTTRAIPKSHTVGVRSAAKVCTACIRGHLEFLASDALRGRGSATPDELVAATYVASELRQYGIEPAGDDDGYIQGAQLLVLVVKGPPQLTFTVPGMPQQEVAWK